MDEKEMRNLLDQFDSLINEFKAQPAQADGFLTALAKLLDETVSAIGSASLPDPERPHEHEALADFLLQGIELGKPDPQPFGVSPKGAELYVAEWLKYLDISVIEVSPYSQDGGYDLVSEEFLVQVKSWNKRWVPVAAIREIYGVSQLKGKRAMVFSRGFLSEDASAFAEEAGIPVFLFNAEEGEVKADNQAAIEIMESCFSAKSYSLTATYYLQLFDFLASSFTATIDGFERGVRCFISSLSEFVESAKQREIETQAQSHFEPLSGALEIVLKTSTVWKDSISALRSQLEELEVTDFLDETVEQTKLASARLLASFHLERCRNLRDAIRTLHQGPISKLVRLLSGSTR